MVIVHLQIHQLSVLIMLTHQQDFSCVRMLPIMILALMLIILWISGVWYSCSDIDSTYFNFDKQDPEFNYRGSYPGYYCAYDYGSDRFGGNSQTIGNERNDTTIMGTFNHTFDIGVNLEARVYRYEDEAYYRSDVNRSVVGRIYDPERIQDHLRTSMAAENKYTPEPGCLYGYTSNGQLYCVTR